jgi:sterol desaturase/sphingolipid hydroxylase (fatty acid hydroxylase superfamily)
MEVPPIQILEKLSLLLGAMIFLLLPVELWRLHGRHQLNGKVVREILGSASPLIPTLLLSGVTTSWAILIFECASRMTGLRVPTTPVVVVMAIVAGDFLYYWEHRCSHRVRAYWAIAHSVHHSSPHYNQSTGLRVSFVDGFLSPLFYVPLALLGLEPTLVGATILFNAAFQQWIHTESIGRLPWLDGWLNTPSNHRVHHASQLHYLDRNYGGILMVWDHLFGTYATEVETPRYGLTVPIPSAHPWEIHTCELRRLIRDLHQAPTFRSALQMLVRGPEFRP